MSEPFPNLEPIYRVNKIKCAPFHNYKNNVVGEISRCVVFPLIKAVKTEKVLNINFFYGTPYIFLNQSMYSQTWL